MKPNVYKGAIVSALLIAYAYLFFFPQDAASAVTDALRLCGTVVLPSLFPYFVLTNCVVSSGLIENALSRFQNGDGIRALLLGFLGGYPLGAKSLAVSVREKRLSLREASELLPLCNNAGASLFFSMVGGKLFGSVRIGVTLYFAHVLSALMIAQIFYPKNVRYSVPMPQQKQSVHFVAAVQDAATTALTVCALIVVFSVIACAAQKVAANQSFLSLLINGMMELSGGCKAAAISSYPLSLQCAFCSLFAGWGGLCIHAQSAAVFTDTPPCFFRYFAIKAFHGVVAFLLTIILFTQMYLLFLPLIFAIIFFLFHKKSAGNLQANTL